MVFDFADYVRLEIPEGRVKKITDGAGNVIWSAGYVNMVPLSTTDDGVTIYNGTGRKYGYRLRSGGAEGEAAYTVHTGYIPVKGGDVIRVSGYPFFLTANNQNAINAYDANFTNIGQVVANYLYGGYGIFAPSAAYVDYAFNTVVEEKAGVFKWVVPPAASGVEYIRVTAQTNTSTSSVGDTTGAALIVTVNEEIN